MEELKILMVLISENDIKDTYKSMLTSNSQFSEFVKKNNEKSIEEIAMDYDLKLIGLDKCIENLM